MEIVRAGPEHEAQILELATRTLGWEGDDRFAALYRWKHDENAFGPSPRWVALIDGWVVGFRVLLRWRFRRPEGTTIDAVRAVDTATDPDHQGKGIFRALTLGALEDLKAEGVGFVFNTPNDQSRPGYLKMGWVELGRPPVAVAPRLRSLPRIARSRTAAELWSTPCRAGRPAAEVFADPVPGQWTTDTHAAASGGSAEVWATDRSQEFLRWRFGLEPLDYRVIEDGEAAVVFRLRRRGHAVEATIAAQLGGDTAAHRRLLRRVLRSSGADYALVRALRTIDPTPAVALGSLSPLVTWRALTETSSPGLGGFAFEVGDLELF